jgi:hypothetical protein
MLYDLFIKLGFVVALAINAIWVIFLGEKAFYFLNYLITLFPSLPFIFIGLAILLIVSSFRPRSSIPCYQ